MSSQQTNAASFRAMQTRLQELAARVTTLEAKGAGYDKMLEQHSNQLQSLETAKDNTQQFARASAADLNAQTKRMDYLDSLIRIGYEANNMALPPGLLDEGEADLLNTNGEVPLSVDEYEVQKDARLKSVVIQTLCDLYGLPHLRNRSSIIYPSVPEDHPEWPSAIGENGERTPYMRFDFGHRYDEAKNWQRIQQWAKYIVEHGAETTPSASDTISRLSHEQIVTACKLRFNYIRKEFCRKSAATAMNAQPGLPSGENQVGDDFIDPALLSQHDPAIQVHTDKPPTTPLNDLRSRATGKYHKRSRQRGLLTGVNAKYLDAKYDSYFVPGAMSDDEDEYKLVDGVWVKSAGVFISREWDFVSQELRDCRDAVDAVPDPNDKARAVRRIRGDPKSGVPRKWKEEKWAMRKWMINADVLALHPDWETSRLVLGNGAAWGEPEVVVHTGSSGGNKRRRGNHGGTIAVAGPGPATEQALQARRALQEAQQHAHEVRGGGDLESLTMNLD